MTATINLPRGQALSSLVSMYQQQPGGAPVDLQDVTASIVEASEKLVGRLTIEVSNPAAGECTLHLSAEDSAKLTKGRAHSFKIRLDWPGGGDRVLPQIWIDAL